MLLSLSGFLKITKKSIHEIWVVITKKNVSNPQPKSFNQVLIEAKKQGLIDSRTKTIDAEKYKIRFTKRIVQKTG